MSFKMSSEETVDVVQTVVKAEERYLLGKRTSDETWEFLGGKVERGEDLRSAAFRELEEETGIEAGKNQLNSFSVGETYRSKDDAKYRLNPVLIEFSSIPEVSKLSREHSQVKWIKLEEFMDYETLGQYKALENLDIVNGKVALAVPKKESRFLLLERSKNTSSSGLWNFPGGKKEPGEDLRETALRELREETELEGEIIRKGKPYLNNGELGYWHITPFLVKVPGEPELNYEHSQKKWIKPQELEKLETLGTSKAMKNLNVI